MLVSGRAFLASEPKRIIYIAAIELHYWPHKIWKGEKLEGWHALIIYVFMVVDLSMANSMVLNGSWPVHMTPKAMVAHVSCRQDSITLIHNFGAIHRPSSKQLPAEGFAANDMQRFNRKQAANVIQRQEGHPKRDLSSDASVAIHDLLILKALMVTWMNSPHMWAHQKGRVNNINVEVDIVCKCSSGRIHVVAIRWLISEINSQVHGPAFPRYKVGPGSSYR